jgi:hypothetical protein
VRCWVVLALAACGGAPKVTPAAAPEVPARQVTGAEALLALLPPGADAVAEVDLARLRANRAAGMVLEVVPARDVRGFDPVRDIDVAVAAVYDLAGDGAATLFLLRGAGLQAARVLEASRLDDVTIAIGPEALRDRVTAGGARPPDAAFLALRAAAMPEKARAASIRVTARLGKAARIAAAGRLGVDEVPATISLWADVEDDAAVVALLGGDDEENARRLAAGVEGVRDRLAPLLPRPVLDALTVETRGSAARVVWVVPPRRLERWARDLRKQILGGDS